MDVAKGVVGNIVFFIINPLTALLFAAGLLVFLWGLVEFLAGLNGIGNKREEGKKHMLWGIIGMFVMTSAFAIVKLISNLVCSGAGCIK